MHSYVGLLVATGWAYAAIPNLHRSQQQPRYSKAIAMAAIDKHFTGRVKAPAAVIRRNYKYKTP